MTVFGYRNDEWKPWTTPDGTPALIGKSACITEQNRRLYMHPQGDPDAAPSGCMPLDGGHYFDYVTRQEEFDEDALNGYEDYKDQLEVMTIDDRTLDFYRKQAEHYFNTTDCGIVLNAEYGNMGATSMISGGYAVSYTHLIRRREIKLPRWACATYWKGAMCFPSFRWKRT